MDTHGADNKKTRIILKCALILTILLLVYTVVDYKGIGFEPVYVDSRISITEENPSQTPESDLDFDETSYSSSKDNSVNSVDSDVSEDSKSEDYLLTPPSQQWVQKQVLKSLEIRGLEYNSTNRWDTCGSRSYYFPKLNTIYTGVPKTGCSNWIEALLRAEGDIKDQIDPTKVKKVHGSLSGRHRMGKGITTIYNNTVFEKAYSFAVVRNPWTRMVSGFRDKVSSEITQGGSFRGIGMAIVRIMRGITDPDLIKDLYPTFSEFARWLVLRQERGGSLDGHFAPQWKTLCIPRVKYDDVIPLEYSGALIKDIWGKINTPDISLLGSYDKASDPRLQSSSLLAKEWFSEIEQETIEKLYTIYRADFALMNYSNFTDPNFPLPLRDEQETR